jgi:hypothetical protein
MRRRRAMMRTFRLADPFADSSSLTPSLFRRRTNSKLRCYLRSRGASPPVRWLRCFGRPSSFPLGCWIRRLTRRLPSNGLQSDRKTPDGRQQQRANMRCRRDFTGKPQLRQIKDHKSDGYGVRSCIPNIVPGTGWRSQRMKPPILGKPPRPSV